MTHVPLTTAIAVAAALSACAPGPDPAEALYVAQLSGLNDSVTGRAAMGEARFALRGDQLVITVDVSGVPGGMAHWQHVHGFVDGHASSCPTAASDANGDGIIDLTETEPVAGTTMVPLHGDPVSLDIPRDAYPAAAATGALAYTDTVSLAALQEAFGKTFNGQPLSLGHRVIFVHGVPATTELPASVASLGPIPAQVTLPIACGTITQVTQPDN